MINEIANGERCYLKAVVLADKSYHDICAMDFDQDENLMQLDGCYGIDAYGCDTNQFNDDGDNTFYAQAMADIWAAIKSGIYRGLTTNGVAWSISGNAAWSI